MLNKMIIQLFKFTNRGFKMKNLIISGYKPGAIGRITELHANYYNKLVGFGQFFEAKVASEMAEFLRRFNGELDGFWVAYLNGKIIGSIAADGIHAKSDGMHLRWFIVQPEYHDRGVGNSLLQAAIDFCKKTTAKRIYLWTFSRLDAARHLYEKFGFSLRQEQEGETWGVSVREQLFELNIL